LATGRIGNNGKQPQDGQHMENQHRRITGYRELSQEEISLMNEVKALGAGIEEMILKVSAHIEAQIDEAYGRVFDPGVGRKVAFGNETCVVDQKRLKDATPERFAALAKTDFQTALMYLTRAVAQPTFF
jgi:hypothetical protein